MSSVSGINNYSVNTSYGSFASGKKINSAADGAAEMAIIEKDKTQANGYDVGSKNISTAQNLLDVSDGALSQINDSLQRIYELGIQASNTVSVSDDDRASIQKEIDGLKQNIADIAGNTTFNEKHLLDGSEDSLSVVTDGNGNSKEINNANATLEALGIADFDVTGDFDLKDITDAMDKVSSSRSQIGAQYNALSYAYDSNQIASYNTTSAQSQLEDLDYPKAISDMKKQETLDTYQLMMQKKEQENKENQMNRMLGIM